MNADFRAEERAPHALGTSATHRRHSPDEKAAPQPHSIGRGPEADSRFLLAHNLRNVVESCDAAGRCGTGGGRQ